MAPGFGHGVGLAEMMGRAAGAWKGLAEREWSAQSRRELPPARHRPRHFLHLKVWDRRH